MFASAYTGINVVRAFNNAIKLAIDYRSHPKDEAMSELERLIRERYV
jgi:hypothetical protein